MPTRPPRDTLAPIQQYLEREFRDRVRRTWWEKRTRVHVFEVSHGTVLHQVHVTAAFLEACPDYGVGLRDSELADYMREAQSHERRFTVVWEGGMVRIRSQLL